MLPELEAADTLTAIEVSSMPHYKPEAQEGVIARLRKALTRGERAPRLHDALSATGLIEVRETPRRVDGSE